MKLRKTSVLESDLERNHGFIQWAETGFEKEAHFWRQQFRLEQQHNASLREHIVLLEKKLETQLNSSMTLKAFLFDTVPARQPTVFFFQFTRPYKAKLVSVQAYQTSVHNGMRVLLRAQAIVVEPLYPIVMHWVVYKTSSLHACIIHKMHGWWCCFTHCCLVIFTFKQNGSLQRYYGGWMERWGGSWQVETHCFSECFSNLQIPGTHHRKIIQG